MRSTPKLLSLCALALSIWSGCSLLAPPEKRVCGKVATLCKLDADAQKQCVEQFPEVTKAIGPDRTSKLVSCVSEADTCAQAGGCLAGSGLSAMTEMMNGFLQGLKKTLQ